MGLFNKRDTFATNAVASRKTLHKNLDFAAIEQYKLIRANLEFTVPENVKCPVIGITSSTRGEGKSTTAINLSYVLAEKGSKVLLIDGDLRIPSIAKKLGIESTMGLSNLLKGSQNQSFSFNSYLLDNWFVLPAGDIPPNPSELLGSARMKSILEKLKDMFDYIVIDTPPVNIVSDPVALSGLIDGMIVVVREEYTEKKEIESCFRQLKLTNVKILGYVMNQSKVGEGSYRKYKKYKYQTYYKSKSDRK